MINNIKLNKNFLKKVGVVGLSLVMSISGFMIGRPDNAKINTVNLESEEKTSDFEWKKYYLYEKFIRNKETKELESIGLFTSDNLLVNTNDTVYSYKGVYYSYDSSFKEDYNEVLVYDKYDINSDGEKQYIGEIHCSIPPRSDSNSFYKFKYLYKVDEEENKNDKTR